MLYSEIVSNTYCLLNTHTSQSHDHLPSVDTLRNVQREALSPRTMPPERAELGFGPRLVQLQT